MSRPDRPIAADRRGPSADGVLLGSAFVLAGLLVTLAGRGGPGPDPVPSPADGSIYADGHLLTTARSGRGDDADPEQIFVVIDSQDEVMMVYEIEDARRGEIIYRDGGSLRALFDQARAR